MASSREENRASLSPIIWCLWYWLFGNVFMIPFTLFSLKQLKYRPIHRPVNSLQLQRRMHTCIELNNDQSIAHFNHAHIASVGCYFVTDSYSCYSSEMYSEQILLPDEKPVILYKDKYNLCFT